MKTYYFTFGSEPEFPYIGGWVAVEAIGEREAVAKFRAHFPDRKGHEGIINCAFVYTSEEFEKTDMYKIGNMGKRCHMTIN